MRTPSKLLATILNALLALYLAGCADVGVTGAATGAGDFVSVDGMQFMLHGKPYRYVGTNMWYAAYIGRTGEAGGDRRRVIQELDFLKANGINNLRLLGASERSPLRDSMSPAISYRGLVENEDILEGLDFFLSEMAKRDMKAVIFLNNFWEWSGGMGTYLYWVNGGGYVDLNDPATPWPAFALHNAGFYSNNEARALFNQYLATILQRRNSVSGQRYRDDPTIMSWQLANEPRPGDGEISRANLPAYYQWIAETASLIKSLAPNQLVSVGSEGTMGCIELDECFLGAHSGNDVDYATFHMWIKNWGWYDAKRPAETFETALRRAEDYISRHIELATSLNMPLVLEEFGIERDFGAFSVDSTVAYRDRFFQSVFARINQSALQGGPLVGSNFWAWGGFGKAQHPDAAWRPGDRTFLGDPPQEPQGLNSVFATDVSTLKILGQHAKTLQTD